MTTEQNKSPTLTDAERAAYWQDLAGKYADAASRAAREIEKLKDLNAELLEALETVYADIELDSANHNGAPGGSTELSLMVQSAIAKGRRQ